MKKAFKISRTILVVFLAVVAVGMMVFTVTAVTTFNRTDRDVFGYNAFIVLSDSMSKNEFNAGDLVLVREVDPSTLKKGDIIAFTSQNDSNRGEIVTHKIRKLTTDSEGNPGFVTFGTATDTDDEAVVTYPHVIGKYANHFSGVGRFFQFLKTVPGYILCIFIPFLLLILMEGVNSIRLFKKYKKEQEEELQAEREKLEKDRAENQKMMRELLQMKERLAKEDETEDSVELSASPEIDETEDSEKTEKTEDPEETEDSEEAENSDEAEDSEKTEDPDETKDLDQSKLSEEEAIDDPTNPPVV